MSEAVSLTFLRTSACVIISVYHFFSWGPIIMKAFDMYVMHVIFAFAFDRNFEILLLWNSGRDCRVTTAIISSSN